MLTFAVEDITEAFFATMEPDRNKYYMLFRKGGFEHFMANKSNCQIYVGN